jgi:hypothetical protein
MTGTQLLRNATEIGERIGENPRQVPDLVKNFQLPAVYHRRSWRALASDVDAWLPGYLYKVGGKMSAGHHRHTRRKRKAKP